MAKSFNYKIITVRSTHTTGGWRLRGLGQQKWRLPPPRLQDHGPAAVKCCFPQCRLWPPPECSPPPSRHASSRPSPGGHLAWCPSQRPHRSPGNRTVRLGCQSFGGIVGRNTQNFIRPQQRAGTTGGHIALATCTPSAPAARATSTLSSTTKGTCRAWHNLARAQASSIRAAGESSFSRSCTKVAPPSSAAATVSSRVRPRRRRCRLRRTNAVAAAKLSSWIPPVFNVFLLYAAPDQKASP